MRKSGIRQEASTTDDLEEQKTQRLLELTSNITNKGVNVLNNVILTPAETAVLSLGLSFIPPTSVNRAWKRTLLGDYDKFVRRVRIKSTN